MVVFLIKLFCVFLCISFRVWHSWAWPESFKMHDKMGWHEKAKLMFLAKDLFKECLLKMRQIIDVRYEHDFLIQFNVGMIMGRIREKYRFMMETYRDIIDSYEDRYWTKPPGIGTLRPLHFIMALEMMHYLEIEIDKLIDVLVDEGTGDLKSKRTVIGQTEPRAWWKEDEGEKQNDISNGTNKIDENNNPLFEPGPDKLVPGKPIRMRSIDDIQREEKEKSLLRQQFLMKKLGMSPNMTTLKKRFQRHWPVEDSWKLDKYNYDYK